jgi:hypothetical protein
VILYGVASRWSKRSWRLWGLIKSHILVTLTAPAPTRADILCTLGPGQAWAGIGCDPYSSTIQATDSTRLASLAQSTSTRFAPWLATEHDSRAVLGSTTGRTPTAYNRGQMGLNECLLVYCPRESLRPDPSSKQARIYSVYSSRLQNHLCSPFRQHSKTQPPIHSILSQATITMAYAQSWLDVCLLCSPRSSGSSQLLCPPLTRATAGKKPGWSDGDDRDARGDQSPV